PPHTPSSSLPPPPPSPLFPYTTLFRSELGAQVGGAEHECRHPGTRRCLVGEPKALRRLDDRDHGRAAGVQRGQRVRRRLRQDERSEEHTSELQSRSDLVCRLLLEKKNK